MNKRITESFTKGKAFIPFITCGDPSLEVTEQLVYAMEEAGADLIELGIPFSDPTAEGPVIQAANVRALSGGVTTDKVFEMVEKIRKNSSMMRRAAFTVISRKLSLPGEVRRHIFSCSLV